MRGSQSDGEVGPSRWPPLCEEGRIRHAEAFVALEEELRAFGGEMEAAGSLDWAEALVWAITDLLVDAPDGERGAEGAVGVRG